MSYVAVLRTVTLEAGSQAGLLFQLHGRNVDDVQILAGPWRSDEVIYLKSAFPNAQILTNMPIPPGLSGCFCLPSARFTRPVSSSVCHVVGVKGGVGKTTLAVLIAYFLSEMGEVCLVDYDEQAGLSVEFSPDNPTTEVITVAKNLSVVLARRGEVPLSGASPELIGSMLGAQFVVIDYGNRAEIPRLPNTVLAVGIGASMLQQVKELLVGFPGAVAVIPSRREDNASAKKMKEQIVRLGFPGERTVIFPSLPIDPWKPLGQQLSQFYTYMSNPLKEALKEICYVTGMVKQPGTIGGDRSKRRFFGL